MEAKLTDKERAFIAVSDGYGDGYGSGDGDGYGSGYGSGYGDGDGYGSGDGYGYGSGDGSGYGDGSGDGSGDGDGYGYGDGSGYGDGYGDGSGDGSGYGDGVRRFGGHNVLQIDDAATILTNIHGNVARGYILQSDLTLTPCYVVKQGNAFAHGDAVDDAMQAVMDKLFDDMPEEERIDAFLGEVKSNKKYPVKIFYEWHHRLTGSCEAGRKAFAKDHGIDIDNDEMTLDEFLDLTKSSYGGSVIRAVIERMKATT